MQGDDDFGQAWGDNGGDDFNNGEGDMGGMNDAQQNQGEQRVDDRLGRMNAIGNQQNSRFS